jgi:hypothetical protein
MRVMLLHKLAEDIPEDYVPPQRLIADVVGVRHQSGPFPSLWAQPKTRLQRRFPSGESRD